MNSMTSVKYSIKRPLQALALKITCMKRSQFMIMDFPYLVKYFASRNPWHLLLYVLPLWTWAIYTVLKSGVSLLPAALALIAGALYWSFLEYAIHRWAYHTHF